MTARHALGAAILALIALALWRNPPNPSKPVASPDAAAFKASDGDFPNDAEAIRSRGFNCPKAFRKTQYPADAYGEVMRVFCQTGAESYVSFRATKRPDGAWMVAPWE